MYTPSPDILEKYSNVLVNFGLNGGKGIEPGQKVYLQIPNTAEQLVESLTKTVLGAGGYPFIDMISEIYDKALYTYGSDEQIARLPDATWKGKIDDMDHRIRIISETDPKALTHIDPKKTALRQSNIGKYFELMRQKEQAGLYTRTLGLYGTEGMAKEANMSLEEYRQQIIQACFLDKEDPISERKGVFEQQKNIKARLDALRIESLHILGEDIDLQVKIGDGRKWLGGSGRNIPSFETFISPDRRGTEGWIRCNQPLYYYGKLIQDIKLVFKNGVVTEATASEGQETLHELLQKENVNKIGEFSLTDKRLSRITKFMASTMYDENIGGQYGNTHIALGNAYKESFTGDHTALTNTQRTEMGFNTSRLHIDVISTTDRIATAKLLGGTKQLIYQDGQFTV